MKEKKSTYSIHEHIHRYAMWTSARAAQRGFGSNEKIFSVFEKAGLKKIISDQKSIRNRADFDAFHKKTCLLLIRLFKSVDLKCSYGRAAKFLAIYIKTAIVIPSLGKSPLARMAHPPIDSILLDKLNETHRSIRFNKYKWTKLDINQYFELIGHLDELYGKCYWKIEEWWMPE